MPELGSRYGYPAVLLLILVICVGLYARFAASGGCGTNRSRRLCVVVDDTDRKELT